MGILYFGWAEIPDRTTRFESNSTPVGIGLKNIWTEPNQSSEISPRIEPKSPLLPTGCSAVDPTIHIFA